MKIVMNQFRWDSLAAFQRATPFQGIDQRTAITAQVGNPPTKFIMQGIISNVLSYVIPFFLFLYTFDVLLYTRPMRYLGIDYGSKRVGIAVSDPTKTICSPLAVLKNSTTLVSEIKDICREKSIEAVVVGESKNYSFKDNFIMKEIRPFVETLKNELGIPVYLHPEFLTSREAEHIQGGGNMLDASAAALILKSYLDKNM